MDITGIEELFVKQLLCLVLRLLQILQNLGKVDRTADDIFDEHLTNFTRQQNAANRLQKEFNNYIRCIRGNNLVTESTIYNRTKFVLLKCVYSTYIRQCWI